VTKRKERRALAAVRGAAPLVRWRLVRLGNNRGWSPETPLLHRPVIVPERIVDWLRGEVAFDPDRFERAAVLRSELGAAKELGLELFRVDLSRVVSKWVGETEKNLGRAFDEAKNSQAVLLFDEGGRAVRQAHRRDVVERSLREPRGRAPR
jgi:hypothetical protein